MAEQQGKIRVALNGYGVIGKRVADAVARQDDMALVGIADIATDWRMRAAARKGHRLFAATPDKADPMREAGLEVAGALDDLVGQADVVVDCTPKGIHRIPHRPCYPLRPWDLARLCAVVRLSRTGNA
jgi:glyceraldehyde-3-phosphate dehydrogenase (NAD(P)+) (phosphorylating)